MANQFDELISRAEQVLAKLESILPSPAPQPDWTAIAFRWRKQHQQAFLQPVKHLHTIALDDLYNIETQKMLIEQNTLQFIAGHPANNVLLTGARGVGKSSLIKSLLNKYAAKGLRLIEIDKQDLIDLPDIIALIADRPERFILYCDDLSFEANDPSYKTLKAVLDGSVTAVSDNLLIYATSNRRHLMPESMADNLATKHKGEEIHPAEAVEEKISLSERFGLWISFYPFDQEEYLCAVAHWLKYWKVYTNSDEVRQAALQWALSRGSRNGRVAWQFARDWAGQHRLTHG